MKKVHGNIDRRTFMTAFGAFCAVPTFRVLGETAAPCVRFGVVTDLHYADLNTVDNGATHPAGKVFYRESLAKLKKAVAVMNARTPDFMIELGDLKDNSGGRTKTLPYLDAAESEFQKFEGPCYHVLGNHDMDCLTKQIFFEHVKNNGVTPTCGYYSFVVNGVTFIVLDACYTANGEDYSGTENSVMNWNWYDANVPQAELAWLEQTLAATKGKAVVFCHQRLDTNAYGIGTNNDHSVKNAADVREILEKSGKVHAVFTGHEHRGGVCNLNGIYYYSLVALAIDGDAQTINSFAEVSVYPSGGVSVETFRSVYDV